jgi:hypothetical protein
MRDLDPYQVVTGANGRITVNIAKAMTSEKILSRTHSDALGAGIKGIGGI